MIPQKIEKLNLVDLDLSPNAKNEVKSIIRNKRNILGFKFRTVENRSVLVGKKPANDFHLYEAIDNLQRLMIKRGKPAPSKFRFVFLSA
jgi:ribosomal protein L1